MIALYGNFEMGWGVLEKGWELIFSLLFDPVIQAYKGGMGGGNSAVNLEGTVREEIVRRLRNC